MKTYTEIYGRLFIDLDGVMADFETGYYNRFGHQCHAVDDDAMWANIRTCPTFFQDLPIMPVALTAWYSLMPYKPIILTACPEKDYAGIADQKHAWVRKHLPGNPLVLPVLRGVNKVRFLQQPGDILVDDFTKNLVPWRDAGGVPVLHEGDWVTTLDTVQALMRLKWQAHNAESEISRRAAGV